MWPQTDRLWKAVEWGIGLLLLSATMPQLLITALFVAGCLWESTIGRIVPETHWVYLPTIVVITMVGFYCQLRLLVCLARTSVRYLRRIVPA